MKDYNYENTRIKEINKLLDEAREALGVLQRASIRVGKASDYSITGLVGRNIVGDFLRSNKNNVINKSIDRSQDVLLKLHADLLITLFLFDLKKSPTIFRPTRPVIE